MTPRADITEPALLIRIPELFRPGLSNLALYEATRGVWRIGPRRDSVRLAIAVADGVVREVYEIDHWQPALTSPYETRKIDPAVAAGRWEFVGRRAGETVRERYIGASVAHYFKTGAQNPIAYVNLDAAEGEEVSRILVPSRGAEDWRRLLADPEKHWRRGYSAFELATRWEGSDGFPPEIASLLDQHESTKNARMMFGIPEHKVALPGGARASQTDLWVLAETASGILSIAVEGKVNESFGPTLAEWAANSTPGRATRWNALCDVLGLGRACDQSLRYQLFHRTASALLEARRLRASSAAMLVHSFSETAQSFPDFQQFVRLIGADVSTPGQLVSVGPRQGISLYLGWAQEPLSKNE
jgi:hypothetical protein